MYILKKRKYIILYNFHEYHFLVPLFIQEETTISVLSIQLSVQDKFVNSEPIQTNLVRAFQSSFYVNLLRHSLHSLDLYKRTNFLTF